jgi:type III secretion system needle length determinant
MPDGISRGLPRPSMPAPDRSNSPDDESQVDEAASQLASLMRRKDRDKDGSDDAGRSTGEAGGKGPRSKSGKSSIRKADSEQAGQQRTQAEDGSPLKKDSERGGSKDESNRQNLSPGEAILQSFSGQQQTGAGLQIQAPAGGGGDTPQTLDRIAQQVASQILVSDASSGTQEVRITLNESILPGTEVRIAETAGRLEVQFLTSSSDSQNTLSQNQAALQDRLTERLGQRDVVVSVKSNTHEHGDQPDSRSRQQRSVIDEYNPDD